MVLIGSLTNASQEVIKNLALKGFSRIILMPLESNYSCEAPLCRKANESQSFPEAIRNLVSQLNHRVEMKIVPVVDKTPLGLGESVRNMLSMERPNFVILANAAQCPLGDTNLLTFAFSVDAASRAVSASFCWIVTEGDVALMMSDFGASHSFFSSGETEDCVSFPTIEEGWKNHEKVFKIETIKQRRISKSAVRHHSALFLKIKNAIETKKSLISAFRSDEDILVRECPAVGAIMGGILAQEVVKSVTRKDLPINNVLIFDGMSLESEVIKLLM